MHSLVESNRTKICDSCEDEIHQDIPLFSCFVCDYDLCEKCSSSAAPDVSSGSGAKKSASKKSVSESKPSDKSGKFNKGKDLQSSSSFMCSFMGFGDTDAFDAVRLIREYLHDFLPDFEVEVVGFFKSGVGIRIWQADVESLKAEFGKNRSSFMFHGTPLTLVDVKAADLKKFTMPKPSTSTSAASSTASSAQPAVPHAPHFPPGLRFEGGLRGSPARTLARRFQVDLPEVAPLPSFADAVPAAPAPAPTPPEAVTLDTVYAFIKENMVTRSELRTMQDTIETRAKEYIDATNVELTKEVSLATSAVVHLSERLDSTNARIDELAQGLGQLKTASPSASARSRSMPAQRGRDPAYKQLAFKKIPSSLGASDRIAEIEHWMTINFPGVRIRDVMNKYTGKFPERKLSSVTLLELSSSDVRKEILDAIKAKSLSITLSGQKVEIKEALTESALERNGALRRAAELLEKDPRCKDKTVKILWTGDRGVTVDGVRAFSQPKGFELGSFATPFSDLKLP